MKITNAQYVSTVGMNSDTTTYIRATIDGTELSVPINLSNRHYAAILKWAEKDGNTIAEAD